MRLDSPSVMDETQGDWPLRKEDHTAERKTSRTVSFAMERRVQPELLDQLPADDPRAIKSRRDLQLINFFMGNAGIMAKALRSALPQSGARQLLEIGAGDGRFMARVARRLSPNWRSTRVFLLDRQEIVKPETVKQFETAGWQVSGIKAEVLDWLSRPIASTCDAIVANLFLHHFHEDQLLRIFGEARRRARLFIAVEPRRSRVALMFSRLFWLTGFNQVTRHDMAVSIRAGFKAGELSRLWPASEGWALKEGRARLFSHLFIAQQIG